MCEFCDSGLGGTAIVWNMNILKNHIKLNPKATQLKKGDEYTIKKVIRVEPFHYTVLVVLTELDEPFPATIFRLKGVRY